MPSKYIFSRLAQTPFPSLSPTKAPLHSEWLSELNARRENMHLSVKQEMTDWTKQADDALQRAATPAAKRYVWREFEAAQNGQTEPALFQAAYGWLAQHQQWAPANNSLLHWQTDAQYQLPSLLAAATHLPDASAIQYIGTWLRRQQDALNRQDGQPRLLPIQKMRSNPTSIDDYGMEAPYDKQELGYDNLSLWKHVLIPALPYMGHMQPTIHNVPYIPYPLEHARVDSFLSDTQRELHPWILSNALYEGDFCERNFHVVNRDNTFKSLTHFVEDVSNSNDKKFLYWDIAHRSEDPKTLIQWVRTHDHDTYALFETLGAFSIGSIRQAMLGRWFDGTPTLHALVLPDNFNLE